jgi:hypothetical protein
MSLRWRPRVAVNYIFMKGNRCIVSHKENDKGEGKVFCEDPLADTAR